MGFEVHRNSNPSIDFSEDVTIDGTHCRRYPVTLSDPNWFHSCAVFSMRLTVRAIRPRISANSSSGRV